MQWCGSRSGLQAIPRPIRTNALRNRAFSKPLLMEIIMTKQLALRAVLLTLLCGLLALAAQAGSLAPPAFSGAVSPQGAVYGEMAASLLAEPAIEAFEMPLFRALREVEAMAAASATCQLNPDRTCSTDSQCQAFCCNFTSGNAGGKCVSTPVGDCCFCGSFSGCA